MDYLKQSIERLNAIAEENGKNWNPERGEPILVSNGDSWVLAFYTGEKEDAFFATPFLVLQHIQFAGDPYKYIKRLNRQAIQGFISPHKL